MKKIFILFVSIFLFFNCKQGTGIIEQEAPELLSAEVSVSGRSITLVFDQELIVNQPDLMSFSLSGTSAVISNIIVSNTHIVLSLQGVIFSDDSITLSYTAGTTAVTGSSNIKVGDFGNHPVENSSDFAAVTDSDLDSDGDSLTDYQEITLYGTSPNHSDTDGDGYSDYTELIEYSFDPSNDPYIFNPCIADVPEINIQLTSPPSYSVNYSYSDGSSFEETREHSFEEGSSQSSSWERAHSVGAEIEVMFGRKVGASVGTDTSASVDVYGELTLSASYEYVTTLNDTQTRENKDTWARAEASSTSKTVSSSEGEIAVTVEITNTGHQSYTVENILLGAYSYNPLKPELLNSVGNLDIETGFNSFQPFTLGPGQKSSGLTFQNGDLYVDDVMYLLKTSDPVSIITSAFEITDAGGISFSHNLTDIHAKCAKIIINYGMGASWEEESYFVATNINQDSLGVTLFDVFNNYFFIPYEVGSLGGNSGLIRIRDRAISQSGTRKWFVLHTYKEVGIEKLKIYDVSRESYDFDNILAKAGNAIDIVYILDEDDDGLPSRIEAVYGTDDEDADSDDDGVSDYDEYENVGGEFIVGVSNIGECKLGEQEE